MRFQKVKYKLINKDNGNFVWLSDYPQNAEQSLYPAPRNWDNAKKTLKRSDKNFSIYTELSNNLEFTKKGAEFLKQGYEAKDIQANFVMEEYIFHPQTEEPILNSTGVFDFSFIKEKDKNIQIPFKSGGLNSIIEAYLSEKFQMEREKSITGVVLDPLETVTVALTSRNIFLVSELNTEPNRTIVTPGIGGIGSISGAFVPNLDVISNSDQENITATFDDNEQYWDGGSETTVSASQCFYFNSNVVKTLNINFDYRIRCSKAGMATTQYTVRLYRYNFDGSTLSYVDSTDVQLVSYQNSGLWVEFNDTIEIDLEQGDCLRIGFLTTAGSGTITSSYINFYIDHIKLLITENSDREDSNTKALLIYEAYDRLMQILTGEKGKFYSEFYGRTDIGYLQTGTYALTGLAPGLWIRQFDDEKIELSLKDMFSNSDAIHNSSYAIETIDGVEKLVVEGMEYFFQNDVVIIFPNQVTNVERNAAREFCHSTMEFGYKNPNADTNNSLYEEAMGLNEFNTKSSYTTPLTRVDTKFSKVSEFRADSYGKEFARRKPRINYPEEDTRYDKNIFVLDLKEGNGEAYEERVWQDDYEEAPQNVYSPETATGLRLTPFRNNERHQWFYNSGLFKQVGDSVRFSNSIGNSELITKKAGEDAKAENSDIEINDLRLPRFVNKWITFNHPVDYSLLQQIYGKTDVNGRKIPNYYFKVKFKNENNQWETGYLFEAELDKKGKFKILKAY